MRLRHLHNRQRHKRRRRGVQAPYHSRDRRASLGVDEVSPSERAGVPTLLITGPGGVGKTTVAFEMSRQLEATGIGHALLDMNELDRIFPTPPDDPHKTHLTRRNLAAVWANLRDAGAARLILTMVAASPDYELPLIQQAVPEASITVVRLYASEEVLLERVRRREVGSGLEYQVGRTLEQAHLMVRQSTESVLNLDTSERSVADVAREILRRTGWSD